MSPDLVESMLLQYGWSFRTSTWHENHTWLTGFSSESRTYPLKIQLFDTFIRFEVQPLIDWSVDWEEWPKLMLEVLNLNNESRMVKLSIDEHGTLLLSAEMLSAEFSFTAFETVVGIIAYYTEECDMRIALRLSELGGFGHRDDLV